MESWFKNIAEANRTWPTFCGNSPTDRPEDLQLQLERGKAPPLEDYIEWFGDWLKAFEASHTHGGQGMNGQTPDAVYAACLRTRRTAPADLLDVLCLKRAGPVKVGRNGVTWKGLRYGQYEPALHQLLGLEVVLRVDERFAGHVQVYTTDDRLVCVARSNQMLPWNADVGRNI